MCPNFDQNGYCTVCPKRCSYKEHKNRDYYLFDAFEEKTVVLEELKRRYFDTKEKLEKNIYKLTQAKISFLDIFNKAKNIYNEIGDKNDIDLYNRMNTLSYFESQISAESE